MEIYMVGLQQTGGMWCSQGRYFPNYKHAEAVRDSNRKAGCTDVLWTIEEYIAVKATKWCESARHTRDVIEVPAYITRQHSQEYLDQWLKTRWTNLLEWEFIK